MRPPALVAAFALAACGDQPASAPVVSRLSLDSIPFLRLADPAAETPGLQSARWATRLPDGGFVVADQYAGALVFADSLGTVRRSVGRRGEGPGEFGNVLWVDRCGTDSLFIWDATRRMILVTDSAGGFAREFRPEGNPWELSCSSSGWIGVLGLPHEYVPPGADGTRATAPVWAVDLEGNILAEFPDVPLGENRPLGLQTRIAAATSGLVVGTADSAWVDLFGLDGARRSGLRVGIEGRPPTQRQFDDAIESMIAITPSERGREIQRQTYGALPPPAALPPYRELFVDPEGLLWAVVSSPGDSATALMAVTPEGDPVFNGALPRVLKVFEIGADYLLAAESDATGQELVVAFRLHRPDQP